MVPFLAQILLFRVFKALQRDVASFGGDESGDGITLSFRVPDVKIHLVLYMISSQFQAVIFSLESTLYLELQFSY